MRSQVLALSAALVWALGFLQSVPGSVRPLLALGGAWAWMQATAGVRRGFPIGWLAGMLFYVIVLAWLTIPMTVYGPLSVMGAWGVVLLLNAYLALYWGVWMAACVSLRRRFPTTWPWLGAALWVGLAHVRAHALTGFPWGQVEALLVEWPILVQWADVAGGPALGGWLLLMGWYAHGPLVRRSRTARIALPALVLIPLIYSGIASGLVNRQIQRAPALTFRAIQPAIPQEEKLDLTQAMAWLHRQITLSRLPHPASVQLVIWPEASVPWTLTPGQVPWEFLRQLQAVNQTHLLVGADRVVSQGVRKAYNSAFLLDPAMRVVDVYDKVHLVPFGEYVPLRRLLPFLTHLTAGIGDFEAGEALRPLQTPWGPMGVLICFESVFPRLSRTLVRRGARLLVIITNDAWFRRSSGAFQHWLHTRLRAVETRRAVVFVANTGISSLMEPTGHVRWRTQLFEEMAIDDRVALLDQPLTLWVRWGETIEGFWMGWAAYGLGWWVFGARRHARKPP